ncbi:MAG: lactonase family protein [Bacteroidales bacterium]|nr:lactonase family protein [Bacteroidales bacterium]
MLKNIFSVGIILLTIIFSNTSCRQGPRLFVGGFTEKEGDKAMSVFEFNPGSGKLSYVSSADVGPSPSYFCFSDKTNLFYVINEVMEFRGQFGGGLSTFRYDEDNVSFEKLNEMLIPYAGPCYISMSADSGHLFIANYPNGSVAVVRLGDNGIPETVTDTILYVKEQPDRSHAHMILHDPAGRYVYVTDLGLDRIVVYDFDSEEGKLNRLENGITDLPRGSGPRHFAFNDDGSRLYVITELGSTMMVFGVEEGQGLKLLQTLPTKKDEMFENNYCADVHISNDGKYLYGSNRGENNIVTFLILPDGQLEQAGHTSCGGEWPRNFVLDPSGRYLISGNQKSDQITVFRINKRTGLPHQAVDSAQVKMPACLKFYN